MTEAGHDRDQAEGKPEMLAGQEMPGHARHDKGEAGQNYPSKKKASGRGWQL